MKKGALVDSVYINLSGGKLSDDVHVQREDIATYLPAAISWAIVKKDRMDKREFAIDGILNNSVSADLTHTYCVEEIKEDCKRGLMYIDLPVPIQALDNNRGVVSMFPTKGETSFRKVGGPNHFQGEGMKMALSAVTIFWYEKSTDGDKIYIKNLSPFVKAVNVQLVPSIPELDDDDTLPIPAGMEVEIIDLCIQYFRMQVYGGEADYIVDNKDDKHR
jgi:hypothetical protein